MIRATKSTRVVGAIALVSLAVALVAVAACENQSGTYVYRGRPYDPVKKCLGETRALDIIEVEQEPALCAPRCLVQNKYDDAGVVAYVSNVCPPYPPGFDTSEANPLCRDAVLAFDRRRNCGPDGGPDDEEDAQVADTGAPDASDAGDDASDAGSDASDASDASSDANDAGPDANDASDGGA